MAVRKEDKTSLQISKTTLTRLKTHRIYRRETLDELVNRLLDSIDRAKAVA